LPKKEYDWEIGDPPPFIEAHSLTKHHVLEDYLFQYLHILTQHPNRNYIKLTLVDGFAGGGEYRQKGTADLQLGSPLRFLQTVDAAVPAIADTRAAKGIKNNKVELDIHYYFVEKKKSNYLYLLDTLKKQGYESRLNENVHVIHSAFEDVADKIINIIKTADRSNRCIFVLDQYGYSQIDFNLIRKILTTLPNAEIVMTIMTGWLVDYLSDDPRYIKSLRKAGLYDLMNIEKVLDSKKEGADWRRIIQYELHNIFKEKTGAKFYTPFFIVSSSSHKSYWLVHLSSHVRAQDEMKNLHWLRGNDFEHYGGAGLKMLGYDAAKDNLLSGQMMLGDAFSFDEYANTKTLNALQDELPGYLHQHENGIIYSNFLSNICNETPATSRIIKVAAEEMIERRELSVSGPNGETRNKATTIKNNDVLKVPHQKFFDFGKIRK